MKPNHLLLLICMTTAPSIAKPPQCPLSKIMDFKHKEIGHIPIYRHELSGAIIFSSIMHVNPDGAPDAYHPDDQGTVHICNGIRVRSTCSQKKPWIAECMADYRKAKAEDFSGLTPVCFFAMATRRGIPVIQDNNDPRPGYFVSTTRLKQPGQDPLRPAGQVDSNTVPFAVIPGAWVGQQEPGIQLGDVGVAYRRSNGAASGFVLADSGPDEKLGEGSIALLQALGHDPFVMRYGTRRAFSGIQFHRPPRADTPVPDVIYVMFPRSARAGLSVSHESVSERTPGLLRALGGVAGLQACAAQL